MVQGRIKRERKRKKVEKLIKTTLAFVELSLCVVLSCVIIGISAHAEQKQEVTEIEEITLVSSEDWQDTLPVAGVAAVIHTGNMPEITHNETVVTQSGNNVDVELISAGTVMYASTNINGRKEPDVNSERLCGISFGDKLEVIEDTGNGWVKTLYKDKEVFVCVDYLVSESPMVLVSSTAYWDKYTRTSASGRELVEGKSIAGKVAWLHKRVNIYKCNSDGTVGEFLGTYRFDDTGYGADSGVGESKLLEGRTIGTIENGTCIDFYMENESDCWNYGRHDVYIQFVD